MRRRRVHYVVQSEMLDGGVIESQIVARARAQARLFPESSVSIRFLEPARTALSPRARNTLRHYRSMWREGAIHVVPFVSRLGARATGSMLALSLARERFAREAPVFHCRGPVATLSAHGARLALGRGRVVFDLRGAATYETAHRFGAPQGQSLSPKGQHAVDTALRQELTGAAVADFVITVSPGMKEYAERNLGLSPDRILVVPSCVEELTYSDEARSRARQRWGVEPATPVFIYSGRIGPERLPDHMFRVFSAAARLRPDARLVLLLYRNDLDSLPARLAAAGIRPDHVVTETLGRDEAAASLAGADLSLFFCEPALRFDVALPIKMAEYLAAGTSLIVNSVARDVATIVRERRVGGIIDHDATDGALTQGITELLNHIGADRNAARQRALDACADLFLWERHAASLRRAYGWDMTTTCVE